MNGLLDTFWVVAQIAFRNLLASRWKTLIIGGIIGFGACLVVVGASLLDGVDRAMRRSITGSVAGHIQVYSSESHDPLEVLGSVSSDSPDIAPLADFAAVKAAVSSVPNVAAVVPMGMNSAIVTSGNTIDQALSRLRVTVTQRERTASSPQSTEQYDAQKAHVRQIVMVLGGDADNVQRVEARHAASADERSTLQQARSAEFWRSFDDDPLGHLEFLENKVASLTSDADMLFLRYVGTDPQAFEHAFDRMKIVDGQAIPPGKRGFLFSKYVYEEQVKLKAARGLDKIKRARDARGRIAGDPELQRLVRENRGAVRELVLQLDAIKTADFRAKLRGVLHSSETDVSKLLAAFFATDDENFDERYRFFYAQLAPALELYRVHIGDDLMIKAFSRSGYQHSASLKVYGTYAFTGLEKSPQAGYLNMMDLVSFRELYGFMTPEREREVAAMRVAAGATDVERDRIEAQLFGADSLVGDAAMDAHPKLAPRDAALQGLEVLHRTQQSQAGSSYDPRDLQRGIVLNAAVLVRDETKLADTMQSIVQAAKRAKLPLKVISWQAAAGMLGQFATLMRAVLYGAVFIIFVVALVIINNSLVMATLERVREFGTLRAIGAQRKLILAMLLLESVVIGLAAGGAGALVGVAILSFLHITGVPAGTDVLSFVFSGPRLFPQVGAGQVGIALATVLMVTVLSSFYPAWIAMRVSPREAMQSEE